MGAGFDRAYRAFIGGTGCRGKGCRCGRSRRSCACCGIRTEVVREAATSCGLARSTVKEDERRALEAGLSWPLPLVDDGTLERLLLPPPPPVANRLRPEPDYDRVDWELRLQGVARHLLWQEYRAANPEGFAYSKFCDGLREWRAVQGLSMRQSHLAGETVFIDYARQKVPITDPTTGGVRDAQIFVGALAAIQYTYVEASRSQGREEWVMSHDRMLEFFGGCPEVIVPDNVKAGVRSPHLYEPEINPTYLEFARHYDLAVIPARSRKPRDKAIVESAVQVFERWILARLRNRTFFGLAMLNEAIWVLLVEFNARAFQKRLGSRRSLYEELDRPVLKPLPRDRYVYALWKTVRPHVDYHVTLDGHHDSVRHHLAKNPLDARLTAATVKIFHTGTRVASHPRSPRKAGHSTVREHMPLAHQAQAGTTRESVLATAGRVGP